MKKLFAFAAVLLLSACQHTKAPEQNACIVTRAAFDIGSASSKLKVAQVNKCEHRVLALVAKEDLRVDYKEALKKSPTLNADIQEAGMNALKALSQKARLHPLENEKIPGVATAAFRSAKNGEAFLQEVNEKLDLNLRIITQEEEAELAYKSAQAHLDTANKHPLVWDIGGGSMQMLYKKDSQQELFEGDLASVSFKELVIEMVKRQKNVKSPNPLSQAQIDKAIELAQAHAELHVPASLKRLIRKQKPAVVGIGGVLSVSLWEQTGHDNITQAILQNTIYANADKDDAALGASQYVDTQLTNMILVLGYMRALKIPAFFALKANLADALLAE